MWDAGVPVWEQAGWCAVEGQSPVAAGLEAAGWAVRVARERVPVAAGTCPVVLFSGAAREAVSRLANRTFSASRVVLARQTARVLVQLHEWLARQGSSVEFRSARKAAGLGERSRGLAERVVSSGCPVAGSAVAAPVARREAAVVVSSGELQGALAVARGAPVPGSWHTALRAAGGGGAQGAEAGVGQVANPGGFAAGGGGGAQVLDVQTGYPRPRIFRPRTWPRLPSWRGVRGQWRRSSF